MPRDVALLDRTLFVIKDLAGRVAVVTGAASGIGLAYARAFASEGMHLVLADVEDARLQEAAQSLQDRAPSVITAVTDVSDAASVQALADLAFSSHPTVHVLCNNAGVSVYRSMLEATVQDWTWMLGVNLWGIIHGIQSFVPTMIERGDEGQVVNTCSIASWTVMAGNGAYSATKHAAAAVSEALSMDLAAVDARIGVTAVCPSLVRTQLFSADRNRPPTLGERDPASMVEQDRVDHVTEGIQTPDEVAAKMVEGVRAGTLWVFPNRGRLDYVRARFSSVVD